MKMCLIFLTFMLSLNSWSQVERKPNEIKINPIRLAGIFRSSFEMSYERKTSDYFSSQIGFGYIFEKNISGNPTEKNKKGFTLELEEKYYFEGDIAYVAVSLFYLHENYNLTKIFIDKDAPYSPDAFFQNTYLDEFNLDKQIVKPSLKFGIKFITESNVVFDLNLGVGAKYKIVKHQNRDNIKDNMQIRRGDFGSALYKRGESWTPNLICNFKIGYQF